MIVLLNMLCAVWLDINTQLRMGGIQPHKSNHMVNPSWASKMITGSDKDVIMLCMLA